MGKKSPYIPFLGMKSTGVAVHIMQAQQFDDLTHFYMKIGQLAKDKSTLEEMVKEYMAQQHLNIKQKHLLMDRGLFIRLLADKFEFSDADAKLFWEMAYNDGRFEQTDSISMKAFIYNYDKYYTEIFHKYKNMFSEHALRQRLIDIRMFLHDWKVIPLLFRTKTSS